MTSYIAIDWGSTNLRAWYFREGICQEERRSESGVTRLNGRTPAGVFTTITEGWPVSELPVIMAGMVGSNAGWLNVPYLPCPVSLGEIAFRLTRVENRAWIVPGLSMVQSDNFNVMRGEETQLLGAARLCPATHYVMPGTHCKWVKEEAGKIVDFRTVMTGELHHVLLNHSLIGSGLPAQRPDAEAFSQGLETGANDRSILSRLFEVRAAHVLGARSRESVSDFLSGLLIGHEAALMAATFMQGHKTPLTLIAGSSLAERYLKALQLTGLSAQLLEGDRAFQHGIRSIADELAY
ncbi:2-oxo-3-deoxygalactonate kinase [Erwinia typographi]|uniref:2-oxo-3-deoxygalactonate kinase n=1 Tax=Erwinia typographi TaxID=371042 RepID=A0A0A3Z8H1_9GAMM|nr:2-dehydro-3-deoxygalactonokinase [Erwinia typographi]KGT95150.1 2-oxo-3-deoxygalactonate kinase [Erwinia typographi]